MGAIPRRDANTSQRFVSFTGEIVKPVDEIEDAGICWDAGADSLFEFCIKAGEIVGKYKEDETQQLANRVKRHISTVGRWARVGWMWRDIASTHDPKHLELLRAELDPSFWKAVAVLHYRKTPQITLEGAVLHLERARKNKWELEYFIKQLPTEKVDSDWQQSALSIAKRIENELIIAPALNVSDPLYRLALKLLRPTVLLLKGLTMTNVIELLIKDGIADNNFRAMHIANGLKLADLKTEEEQLKRARLYRDWRVSKIFPAKDTASCFAKAIAGEPVPQLELIEGAMHSESVLEKQ